MLQQGCPGRVQQEAAASPGPVAEPLSLCMPAKTLSYSQCLGRDGKQLPGEGIHLILACLASVPGPASAAPWQGCDSSAEPWCWRRQVWSATGDLLLPCDGAEGMGKVQRLLTAETQKIQIHSCSHDGNVWEWGLQWAEPWWGPWCPWCFPAAAL